MSNLNKVKNIFSGSALKALLGWSRPVRVPVMLVSGIGILTSLLSLGVTLVTKGLIDGAASGRKDLLWRYGIALVALIALERVLSVVNAAVGVRASARFQAEGAFRL